MTPASRFVIYDCIGQGGFDYLIIKHPLKAGETADFMPGSEIDLELISEN